MQSIDLNSGSAVEIYDGDWNVYVAPSEDPGILKNAGGAVNATGLIEFEVNSAGPDLRSIFPAGTKTIAEGEWVYDTGHADKTELHPLNWIRTTHSEPMQLYVAQDDSGRFVDSGAPLWEIFDFPIPIETTLVPAGQSRPSRTTIWHERGRIARGTAGAYLGMGVRQVIVMLDPWGFYDCESVQRVSYGDSPFYHGSFATSVDPLLSETAVYSIGTLMEGGAQHKMAMLSIDLELTAPPQGALSYSRWTWDDQTFGGTPQTRTITRQAAPHSIRLSMIYSPLLDYHQHRMTLEVLGSTHPDGVPQLDEARRSFAQSFERTIVAERRIYQIGQSAVGITVTGKSGLCDVDKHLFVDAKKILPGIGIRSARWSVQTVRDGDGFTVSSSPVVSVISTGPVDTPWYVASNPPNPSGPSEMRVVFKPLPSGEPSLAQVRANLTAVTELGEETTASRMISAACGIGQYSVAQVLDYAYRYIAKTKMAGEPYAAFAKASPTDRLWITAFYRWKGGERISLTESKALLKILVLGERLPPVELPSQGQLRQFRQ